MNKKWRKKSMEKYLNMLTQIFSRLWTNIERKFPQVSKGKSWVIPGFLALVGGAILFQSVHQYQTGLVEVLIATRPISQGEVLSDQDFEPKRMNKENLPMGTISAQEKGKILGQRVLRPIGDRALILW